MFNQAFNASLTIEQKANWRKLIAFIRSQDGISEYNHESFCGSDESDDTESRRCALSYAILAGMTGYVDNYNAPSTIDKCDRLFGQSSHSVVFDADEDRSGSFAEVVYQHNGYDWDSFSPDEAADLLLKYVFDGKASDDVQFVTVHWKSNQKDNFASVEALQSYFDLNPHRVKGYRKLTATKLVPRTVFDEVVETITL